MTNSVFDGGDAANAETFVPTIDEAEYAIINPDVNYTIPYNDDYLYVDLPFEFPFNGGLYDVWLMSSWGWISPNLGLDADDLYSLYWGIDLIQPAPYYWYGDEWPGIGYKVNDSRGAFPENVVFQWYVWDDGDSEYRALKNVFEVWLYANGDIEFRYAMMEGPYDDGYYGYYYGYGVSFDTGMNWDLSLIDSNFMDLAWHSVYFAAEFLSEGGGLLTVSGGNTTASVTTSEFSNYVDYGLFMIAENGWMVADVTESSFSHIYNDGEGALHAVAYNDAMDLTVQNDEFSYLYAYGVSAIDNPSGDGGEVSSSMIVTDNTFYEVIASFDLESYVYVGDNWRVNEEQAFDGVKTFSNNLGEHVGIGYMGTFVFNDRDLNWTIAETDTLSDNNLTGMVSIWLQMIDGPGDGAMLEAQFVIDNENLTVIEANWVVEANDNILTDPGLWLTSSTSGIEITSDIFSDGRFNRTSEVMFEASVVADNNNITALEEEFDDGIYIELETSTEDTDVLMMTAIETNFNVLKSYYGFFDDAIFAESSTFGDEGTGSQDLFALFNASGNVVMWADEGIYLEAGVQTNNQRGHANVDTTMIVEDNEVYYCEYGIDEEVWVDIEFDNYFPPYQEPVSATGNLLFNCLVLDNFVYGCDDGVYLYADTEAIGDEYGVFSEASATSTGAFTVTGNYIGGDVEAYLYSYAQAQMSDAVANYVITFEDNELYGYFDAYTYTYAWTAYLRYFDTMTATMNFVLNANNIAMYNDGAIYVDNYVYTGEYSGSGVATLNEQIDIHDVQGFSIYDDGVYIYTEVGNEFGYGGYPLAVANITASITHNEITGAWGDTGIGFEVVRDDEYTDVLGEVTIADNVIQYMDEGIYVAGELHEFWDEIPVYIQNNTMTDVNTGIYIDDGLFYIYDNRITYANDGITIYGSEGSIDKVVIDEIGDDGVGIFPIGTPSSFYEVPYEISLINSVISNVSNDAIHVEEARYLTIADNEITNVGDDGIDFDSYAAELDYWWYSYYVWVMGNTFTSIGDDAMYFFGVEYLYINDNTITNAFGGIWVEETYWVEITGNVISDVFDGIGIEDSSYVSVSKCTLNGLPASELGVIELGGMYIVDSYMVEVLGTTIAGFENGIYADDDEYLMFEDVSVTGSVEFGISIFDSYMVQIGNSTVSGSGMTGVEIAGCDEVLLINNNIARNGFDGLLLIECDDVLLINGDFVNNGDYGILAVNTTLDWIVNETANVRSNDVQFGGDLTVKDGGVLSMVQVYFYVDNDDDDGLSTILVENGGTMYFTDSTVLDNMADWYAFNVFGTLEMTNSVETGAIELLLGAGSNAYIESSTIAANDMNGIHIVDSAPMILTSTIVANDRSGILIEGSIEGMGPSIIDNMILFNLYGVYAVDANLEGVTDNLFILNFEAGIYAEGVTGTIHDNTLVLDGKEIYVKDSSVSVMNNEIGYTRLVQVLAQLVPLLGGDLSGDLFGYALSDLDVINDLIAHHTGLYAVNSQVTASGNTYGLLMTAVILTQGSELTFADTIKQDVLLVPYMGVDSVIRNLSIPIPVYDGIIAIDSSVIMNGAKIDVLDDALFLDHSDATVGMSTLNALDFSIYAIHGSTANVVASVFGKVVAEDTSVINVSAMLTVVVEDPWGVALAEVPVNVTSATHVSVSGVTDSNGVFARIVAAYTITASGTDMTVEPYTVKVNFTSVPTSSYPGFNDVWSPLVVTKTVTVAGATSVTVQTSLIVNYMLTTIAQDPMGNVVPNAAVVYRNAMGTEVRSGVTNLAGIYAATVVAFIQNPTGPDNSMNPYSVNVVFPATGTGYAGTAVFMPRDVAQSVNVDQQTKTVTIKTGLWMYFDMTVFTKDKDNHTAANIMVTVYDATGAVIRQAPTDSNGTLKVSVVGWKMSADGVKDVSVNPYQVWADFASGLVKANVDMSGGPVAATLKEGAPPTNWAAAGVMGIAAAFIAGGSLLLIARKP
ncbi:MAG: right-handed parallel beta-helix repeat-containing protein [Methanomassiliicoccales archaeon]|nr:right-handed parallel beta-helix repeat-containing protein [Methanomassiliicoccales archaeon]